MRRVSRAVRVPALPSQVHSPADSLKTKHGAAAQLRGTRFTGGTLLLSSGRGTASLVPDCRRESAPDGSWPPRSCSAPKHAVLSSQLRKESTSDPQLEAQGLLQSSCTISGQSPTESHVAQVSAGPVSPSVLSSEIEGSLLRADFLDVEVLTAADFRSVYTVGGIEDTGRLVEIASFQDISNLIYLSLEFFGLFYGFF